jgi:hypothetical protein
MQQLGTQLRFQLLHGRRRTRLGQAQAVGRPGKTCQLRDPHEDVHGFDPIHGLPPSVTARLFVNHEHSTHDLPIYAARTDQ